MGTLLIVPLAAIGFRWLLKANNRNDGNAKLYMVCTAIVAIFIMGFRYKFSGTLDTSIYCNLYEAASNFEFLEFLERQDVFEKNVLLSEGGFYTFVWFFSMIVSHHQFFIFITSAFVIISVALFIWKNSDNFMVSWLAFSCLGLMTFCVNGTRQALAMAICLFAYEHAKEKRLVKFLLIVFIATLFHKTAIFFAIVYFARVFKPNLKSVGVFALLCAAFLTLANQIAAWYDEIAGEDYAATESFDDGGIVTILIYILCIFMYFVFCREKSKRENYLPVYLTVIGLALYTSRYLATMIYERMSYYFFFFLIILFPAVLPKTKYEDRVLVEMAFAGLSILLFVYRINSGIFTNYRLFW